MKYSILRIITRIKLFIQNELWNDEKTSKSSWNSIFKTFLRIIIVSYQRFSAIQFSTQAAALTYFSLVSIVPVFAVGFAIAKGFNLQEKLYEQLLLNFESQKYIVSLIIDFTENTLSSVNGGLLAFVSLIFIFWTVLQVMTTIELAFNQVWEIKEERTWVRKFTDYLTIAVVTPLFLIVAGSLNVVLASTVQNMLEVIGVYQEASFFIDFLGLILPYIMIWFAFTFLFMAMPNASIPFKSAFYAAIVAGTLFQLTQVAYIHFQIGVSRANAIYGSFAALPLFFVWLQTSWQIILLGVIISYGHRNKHVKRNLIRTKVSLKAQLEISFLVWNHIKEDFQNDKTLLTFDELYLRTDLSLNDLNRALNRLFKAKLIHEVKFGKKKQAVYLPNFNPDLLREDEIKEKIMSAKV